MFGFFQKFRKKSGVKNSFEGAYSDFYKTFIAPYQSASGVAVTPESSKSLSAVYACKRLISESVSLMPLPIYERQKNGERVRADHDIWWLLNESPSPAWTAAAFIEYIVDSKLLYGDGFARIHRNKFNEVTQIEPLSPSSVTVGKLKNGELFYQIYTDQHEKITLDAWSILHFAGHGFNGTRGESVISFAAKNAIGTGVAAEHFSGEFFKNGASPSIVIHYPQGVAPTVDQQNALRAQFEERLVGRGNHHRPMVLTNGGEVENITVSPADAQLIESRRFQVVDVCRAFGVPPDFVGENQTSAWGTGLEQRSIGFVKTVINPHARKIEQELNRKLWPRSSKYFVEFNREGLLAGDSMAEANYFKSALGGPGAQGWMTVNEVRKIKNQPALPDEWANTVHQSAQQRAGENLT